MVQAWRHKKPGGFYVTCFRNIFDFGEYCKKCLRWARVFQTGISMLKWKVFEELA
jgi:hypothetical protein